MSGALLESADFPAGKAGNWVDQFERYGVKTPLTAVANTLAVIIERRGKLKRELSPVEKGKMERVLRYGYGWPEGAIGLFFTLSETMPVEMVPKLKKYYEEYQDYYGGKEKIGAYIDRCKKRAKKVLGQEEGTLE